MTREVKDRITTLITLIMNGYFSGPWNNLKKNRENIELIKRVFPRFSFYDLGSTGGTPPPFCWFEEGIQVVNFEPDKRGVSSESGINLPIAIGPEHRKKIYLNSRPTTSSLLEPNYSITNRYDFSKIFPNEDPEIFRTVNIESIETVGLDNAITRYELPKPDFIKIDVQGLTLEVLETAKRALSENIVGVEVEVEFFECYKGQESFGVIHEYMLKNNFEIFRIKNINPWYYKTELRLNNYSGQDTFCDFIYFKNIDTIGTGNFWTKSKSEAALLCMLMYDLVDSAAAYYEKFVRTGILNKNTKFESLIENWDEALFQFYLRSDQKAKNSIKLMDISPRILLKKLKSILR